MFEPKSEGETLCDTCLDTEVVMGVDMASGPDHQVEHVIEKPGLDRLKVLSFSTLHFLLPDDFEGGLGDALRVMADYHDSVQRGETKDPPSLVEESENRSGSLEEHEAASWDFFLEALENNLRVSGTVCVTDYIRGDDDEWESKYMDLVDGKQSGSPSDRSVVEKTFVIANIKADEPTVTGRIYSSELLQAMADQAKERIQSQLMPVIDMPNEIAHIKDSPAMAMNAVGKVRGIQFDGKHLVVRALPMHGREFKVGARLMPVMEGLVIQEGKVTRVEKATIVRFDLLPAKDKD
jgi:hypothetical protein